MTQICSNCGAAIDRENAIVCSGCGKPISEDAGFHFYTASSNNSASSNESAQANARPVYSAPPSQKKTPILALILSFLFTGLGQVYNGNFWKGVFFFVATSVGYCFLFIPGLAIWIWCMWDAFTEAEKINRGELPYKEPSVWGIILFIMIPVTLIFVLVFVYLMFAFLIFGIANSM